MSFPRYEKYKQSAVEWLGDLPEHWSVTKLKFLATKIGSGKTPLGGSETYLDDGVLFLRSQNIYDDGLRLGDVVCIADSVDEAMASSRVQPGDILLNITGASIGRTCILPPHFPPANVNQHVCAIRIPNSVLSEFVSWLLKSTQIKQEIDYAQDGAAREGLNFQQIGGFHIPMPPDSEQKALCKFLTVEAAKIDALVEEQRRLIELLKEKRQAVISQAVTKGLNPNVTMKDSGVEWLGQIPMHWRVTALKRLCATITDGAHISPETEGGVFPFISTRDVSDDRIDFDDCLKTTEESFDLMVRTGCRPRAGDVLFSKDGTIGRTVLVHEDRDFVVASSLIIIRPTQGQLRPDYLNVLCQSNVVLRQVDGFVKGAGLPRLSIQNLQKVIGVFPPIEEQQEIAGFVLEASQRFDALGLAARETMGLLQERRAALISAAVTGKIDVRGLVAEPEAVAA